tara:strand:+ start:529 stop:924 length:396 start_codon:yes stop_codon:yes gene_type:complete
MKPLPLRFTVNDIEKNKKAINQQVANGGYLLLDNISFQILENIFVVRTFTTSKKDITRSMSKEKLKNSLSKVHEIIESINALKGASKNHIVDIGLYYDYGIGSVKLCHLGESDEIEWHHPLLITEKSKNDL